MKCSECDQDHDEPLHMSPGCHPKAALDIFVDVHHLTFRCNECDALVAEITAPVELLAKLS